MRPENSPHDSRQLQLLENHVPSGVQMIGLIRVLMVEQKSLKCGKQSKDIKDITYL
jgi:hypothetical protein